MNFRKRIAKSYVGFFRFHEARSYVGFFVNIPLFSPNKNPGLFATTGFVQSFSSAAVTSDKPTYELY